MIITTVISIATIGGTSMCAVAFMNYFNKFEIKNNKKKGDNNGYDGESLREKARAVR